MSATGILGTVNSELPFAIARNIESGGTITESVADNVDLFDYADYCYQVDYICLNVFNGIHDPHRRLSMKLISITAIGFIEEGYLCKLGEAIRYTNHDIKAHTITGPFTTFTIQPKASQDVVLNSTGLQSVSSNQFPFKGQLNVQVT